MCDMGRWAGRVALVTGASGGIGAAVASALVKHGMIVVSCSRNPEKIEELSKELAAAADVKGKPFAQKCDVSKPEEVLELFKTIQEKHGGVDVCVNNAGLSHNAPVLTGEVDQWRDMLEINVLGLCLCTREAVKSMRAKNVDDGHIFNVSSMTGHRVAVRPASHFYSATKFAVTALTESTRQELRDLKSNIRITQISPAVVETTFHHKLLGKEKGTEIYRSMKVSTLGERVLSKDQCLQPENLAETVVFSLSCPPHMQQISPAVVETTFHLKLLGKEKGTEIYRSMKVSTLGERLLSKDQCLQPENLAETVVFSLSCPPHMQIHDVLLRPVEQVT